MARPRLAALFLLPLAACAADPAREADRPYREGLAAVERLDLQPLPDSQPLLRAVARGVLPDSCTRIGAERHERRGRLIRVRLETRRPRRAGCESGSRPFARVLWIAIDDLAPGLYTLEVNGVVTSFDVPGRPGPPPHTERPEQLFD